MKTGAVVRLHRPIAGQHTIDTVDTPGQHAVRIEDPALTSGNTQSSTGFGLNAQVGARYYITRQVALFGEGKFNYTKFSFDETPAGLFNLFGFDANYRIFHAVFGLSVHF
ncbi:MAG: hypothetical protein HP477_09240 [Nitrospira sp.]|nr:hypothetical protein [Nitrospira sp.]